MRVLHVISGLDIGGPQQQLRLLLRRLPVSCEVVNLGGPGAVAEGLRVDGVRVTHLGVPDPRDPSALARLVRLIRDGRYHLVHTHRCDGGHHAGLAARLAGVRTVVATEHRLGATTLGGRPLTRRARALYRATERLRSATVAVSATVASRLRALGVPADRIHVVPPGVEAHHLRFDHSVRAATRARLGIPDHAFVVAAVGRLVPAKGYETLVRAVAALPETQVLLAGDGPERDRLRRLAVTLGAARRVHLLGDCAGPVRPPLGRAPSAHPSVPEVLAAADVFVSPAPEESFGIAVVEALAAGLPVLHAGCPALDELPRLQAPGAQRIAPTVRELCAALREQAAHPARRLPVPPAVTRYDADRAAEALATLYTRVYQGAPVPAAAPGAVAAGRASVPSPATRRHDATPARSGQEEVRAP